MQAAAVHAARLICAEPVPTKYSSASCARPFPCLLWRRSISLPRLPPAIAEPLALVRVAAYGHRHRLHDGALMFPTLSLPPLLPGCDQPAPLQRLDCAWLEQAAVELALLRLDLLDPRWGGNKAFKLAPILAEAQRGAAPGLISLGGAHSNHLHALAAAGQHLGLLTVGLLRGHPQDTPTVRDLARYGMQLHWLGYGGYRQRHQADFWAPWQARYPGFLILEEGGSNLAAAHSCARLVTMIEQQKALLGWSRVDQIWAAAGTGTTLAGLALGAASGQQVVGALAVPPDHGVSAQLQRLLQAAGGPHATFPRLIDASRGGFARIDAELARFMQAFEQEAGVALEPLYTGKLLLELRDALQRGEIRPGTRIVAVHSGGLQGRRALQARLQHLARA